MSNYSYASWTRDKVIVGRLVKGGELKKARDFLNSLFIRVCDDPHAQNVVNQIHGMLFIIELTPNIPRR